MEEMSGSRNEKSATTNAVLEATRRYNGSTTTLS
jgi:hypothetical protein